MRPKSRREFLTEVGQGMLVASVGLGMAVDMGLAPQAVAEDAAESLSFGPLDSLVDFMHAARPDRVLPALVDKLRAGVTCETLVAAGALANARAFGGEDYVGFHTLMALPPALAMARELPAAKAPLPILKVLYRNTQRLQETGGGDKITLRPVKPKADPSITPESLREAVRRRDLQAAETQFAALAQGPAEAALNHVLTTVEDAAEVHRTVLVYRAWELLGVVGKARAHTLLRQSVRYCVKNEHYAVNQFSGLRALLPKVFDQYRLEGRTKGRRPVDDAWVDEFSRTVFSSRPDQAADAVAAAISEGIQPQAIGEAISLAANQLVLRDRGRPANQTSPNKPVGSVHGDSIGVHASDSANAWRHLALAANDRHSFACLILAGWQVAYDRGNRGGKFLEWSPYPLPEHAERVKVANKAEGLRALDGAIRSQDQALACAITAQLEKVGVPAREVFDLLLRYAVSEDGALHAEKYYRTVADDFAVSRPAFRWRHLQGLARVTASAYGQPAPGYDEACRLLGQTTV